MVDYLISDSARNEQVSVEDTSVLICQPFPRQILVITNTSIGGQSITLSFGSKPAIVNNGVVLAQGQTIAFANSEGFQVWNYLISAVSSAAGGKLSIMEY